MKVYVETNFLVEVALAQEECVSCEEILSLSEAGRTQLIFPAFCIPEAYHALVGRHLDQLDSLISSTISWCNSRDRQHSWRAPNWLRFREV